MNLKMNGILHYQILSSAEILPKKALIPLIFKLISLRAEGVFENESPFIA